MGYGLLSVIVTEANADPARLNGPSLSYNTVRSDLKKQSIVRIGTGERALHQHTGDSMARNHARKNPAPRILVRSDTPPPSHDDERALFATASDFPCGPRGQAPDSPSTRPAGTRKCISTAVSAAEVNVCDVNTPVAGARGVVRMYSAPTYSDAEVVGAAPETPQFAAGGMCGCTLRARSKTAALDCIPLPLQASPSAEPKGLRGALRRLSSGLGLSFKGRRPAASLPVSAATILPVISEKYVIMDSFSYLCASDTRGLLPRTFRLILPTHSMPIRCRCPAALVYAPLADIVRSSKRTSAPLLGVLLPVGPGPALPVADPSAGPALGPCLVAADGSVTTRVSPPARGLSSQYGRTGSRRTARESNLEAFHQSRRVTRSSFGGAHAPSGAHPAGATGASGGPLLKAASRFRDGAAPPGTLATAANVIAVGPAVLPVAAAAATFPLGPSARFAPRCTSPLRMTAEGAGTDNGRHAARANR